MAKKEYIEREAAVSELNRIEKLYQNTYMSNVRAEMASYCCQVIKHIPAADVEEVRHGRWEIYQAIGSFCLNGDFDVLSWQCSECRGISTLYSRYCPHCGAKMTEV